MVDIFNWFKRLCSRVEIDKVDEDDADPIATAIFKTVNDDGSTTATHICTYYTNTNGNRFTEVESTSEVYVQYHSGLITSKTYWRIHGTLPDHAVRVEKKAVVKLQLVKTEVK